MKFLKWHFLLILSLGLLTVSCEEEDEERVYRTNLEDKDQQYYCRCVED